METSLEPPLDCSRNLNGSTTNLIANNVFLDDFNEFVASLGWFVSLLTGS